MARGASRFTDLPYDGRLSALLDPLHRTFGLVNRWLVVPAFRAGLGPLFSTPVAGSMLVLRTTGRTTGLPRSAPLGYAIVDGAIYCCAGFGRRTSWYRNLVADPRVEVMLPTIAVAGRAEPVVDEAEWSRVFPIYARALGIVARATLGDVRHASPERLRRLREELPLVRIQPTGLAAGPSDPGGSGWAVALIGWLVALRAIARATGAWRRRSGRSALPAELATNEDSS